MLIARAFFEYPFFSRTLLWTGGLLLGGLLFFALQPFTSQGASYTWDGGGGDNNWSTCENWTSDTCPGASDIAIFDGTSTKAATIDASFGGTVSGLQINAGYTDTITMARSLTIGTDDFSQAAGTFAQESETLTLNTADFTITGGTFDDGTGTVIFDVNAMTFDVNTSLTLNNVTFDTINQFQPVTIAAGDTMVVAGTLTFNTGAVNGPGSLEMEGAATVVGSTGTQGTAIVEYLTAGNQTITGSGGFIPGVLVNKPSDNLTQSGNITIGSADFELQSGTYVVGANTFTLDTADFTITGGTFDEGTGTVIFDGNAQTFDVNTSLTLNNVTFDTANDFQAVTIAAGDTMVVAGTLTFNTGAVNGPGSLEMEGASTVVGGTGTSGTAPVQYLVAGNQTITSSGGEMPGILINKPSDSLTQSGDITLRDGNFELQGGTYDAGSGTLALLTSDFTITGGTFDEGTGTVIFDGNAQTFDVNTSLTLNNVTFDTANDFQAVTIAAGDTMVVAGTLTFNTGAVNGPGSLEMEGASTVVGGTGTSGTAPVQYLVAGNQTITSSGGEMPGILINKPSDSLTQSGDITLRDGNFELQGGTYITGANTITLQESDFTASGGIFTATGSTVTITNNASTIDVDTSVTFNNLTIDKSNDTHAVTIAAGDTIVVEGTLLLQDGQLDGGTVNMQGITTTIDGLGADSTTTMTFSGSAAQTYELVSGDEPDGSVTVNKDGGSLTLLSSLDLDAAGQDLTISNGTVKTSGNNITIADVFTGGVGMVLEMYGSEAVSYNSNSYSIDAQVHFVGDADGLADTFDLTQGNALSYPGVTFNSTDGALDVFTLDNDLVASGNFTLTAGELQAGSNTITVGRHWSRSSATFTPGTSTVNLNGTSQIVGGSTTFYNFTKTTAAADTLTFDNNATQTITNTMTLQGASGQLLSLRSVSSGDQWEIDPQGTRAIQYLDVQDSNNVNATSIAAHGVNVTDSGNNTNWSFVANNAPSISADPSDGGSDGTAPTNVGSAVAFTATATDDEGHQYYLAICKTDAVTAQSDAAPTCDGGSWAISTATDSGTQASTSYTGLSGDAESNDWFAFVCDKTSSNFQCSTSAQGSGVTGSPFVVNHEPSVTSVSDSPDPVGTNSTLTFTSVASDSDTVDAADTLSLFVCKATDATSAGCGAGGTWCSATAASSNPTCAYNVPLSDAGQTHSYHAYLFDNHDFASNANPQTSDFTVPAVSGGGTGPAIVPPPPPPPPPVDPPADPPVVDPPPADPPVDPPDDPVVPPPTDPPVDDPVVSDPPPSDPAPADPSPPTTPSSPSSPSAPAASAGGGSGGSGGGAGAPESTATIAEQEPDPELRQNTPIAPELSQPTVREQTETTSPIEPIAALVESFSGLPEPIQESAEAVSEVAPVAGAVVGVASTFPSLFAGAPLADLPLLLRQWWNLVLAVLGLRRRKPWGTVFDSMTKQPLDPAYVTLTDEQGKEVVSSVTDLDGRYGFLAKPGRYRLKVDKSHYQFPSTKYQGLTADPVYDAAYLGQPFILEEGAVLSHNIPLDPINFDWNEFAKREQKLMQFYTKRYRWLRSGADWLFAGGLLIATVDLLFRPRWYAAALIGLYLLIALLRHFGLTPKAYGTVTNKKTGKPLRFALVEIRYPGLDQVLQKSVTDAGGRFYALVSPGQYEVTLSRRKQDGTYEPIGTQIIDAKRGLVNQEFVV